MTEEKEEEESDEESGDETELGGEEDSGLESDDDLDSGDDDSVSDSEDEYDSDEEDEPSNPGTGTGLATTFPGPDQSAPGVSTPAASAPPESQPTDPSASDGVGTANSPAETASEVLSPGSSTTQQIISQAPSVVVSEALSEATPEVSSSTTRDERASTETITSLDLAATSLGAAEVNSGEESAPAISRGEAAGISLGALGTSHPITSTSATSSLPTTFTLTILTRKKKTAGLGLLIALGIFFFKWRKRRGASVYDRPPPPGVHDEYKKRGSGAPVVHVEQLGDGSGDGAARGSADRRVSSWIRGTASMFSQRGLTAPAPVFVGRGSNRETGSEAKWG